MLSVLMRLETRILFQIDFLSGFSQRSCMLCVGTKRSSGTGKHFKNERDWGRVTVTHVQIKNYTTSAESPFLFLPRKRWKEALLAGYRESVSNDKI